MINSDWVKILVVVVILGSLATIGKTVYDINGTLNGVAAQVLNTEERVERIAKVLPEMGRRIASEELINPITTAVIATQPIQRDGVWAAGVFIFDLEAKQRYLYRATLLNRDDRLIYLTIQGSVHSAEPTSVSFNELKGWSVEVNQPVAIPPFVDGASSFVLREKMADAYIGDYMTHWLGEATDITVLEPGIENWPTLLAYLDTNKDAMKEIVKGG